MYNFITIAKEQLNRQGNAVDLPATAISLEKGTRNRALVRVLFTTDIAHTNEALPDIRVPISALNKILDVQLISFLDADGAFLDRALLTKEADIEGTTVVFTAAGEIPRGAVFKFDVVGTN